MAVVIRTLMASMERVLWFPEDTAVLLQCEGFSDSIHMDPRRSGDMTRGHPDS